MKKKYYNLTLMGVGDGHIRYRHNLAHDNIALIIKDLIGLEWFLLNAHELTKDEFEFLHRQMHVFKIGGEGLLS